MIRRFGTPHADLSLRWIAWAHLLLKGHQSVLTLCL